ncbi:hypothetical protein GBAR_LOCUS3345 [Geodia barretti]|uniref:Anoctamin dimerisation domain-containing protein n=1 Tax=Geodia barretti TaxID=519541 RepID=A0AA35R2Z2_GEOBA|nr:hypothetical protein GBAR_LOCUS3345 [Geodia barretti]
MNVCREQPVGGGGEEAGRERENPHLSTLSSSAATPAGDRKERDGREVGERGEVRGGHWNGGCHSISTLLSSWRGEDSGELREHGCYLGPATGSQSKYCADQTAANYSTDKTIFSGLLHSPTHHPPFHPHPIKRKVPDSFVYFRNFLGVVPKRFRSLRSLSAYSRTLGVVISAQLARFTPHVVSQAARSYIASWIAICKVCEFCLREKSMAQPAYPSLEPEGGKIGFEGLAPEGDQRTAAGSFSVQFTPSAGDKQQLNDETQPSYKTFEAGGEPPTQASSEEINLLEKGTTQSEAEKKHKEQTVRFDDDIRRIDFILTYTDDISDPKKKKKKKGGDVEDEEDGAGPVQDDDSEQKKEKRRAKRQKFLDSCVELGLQYEIQDCKVRIYNTMHVLYTTVSVIHNSDSNGN